MRKRITYANVAATLALVLAMSGGALAAKHYLINSTRQINPKVLKKLKGARGAVGPNGLIGPQGVTGLVGPKGSRGPQGEPGFSALSLAPSGKSQSGEFSLGAPDVVAKGMTLSGSATFSVPLAAAIAADHVKTVALGGAFPTECPGVGQAARAWLCLYVASATGLEASPFVYDPEAKPPSEPVAGSGRFGFGMLWTTSESPAPPLAFGTYTVTAP